MVTFASTAKILSSEVFNTGLISNNEASAPSYARYNALTNFTTILERSAAQPKVESDFTCLESCQSYFRIDLFSEN